MSVIVGPTLTTISIVPGMKGGQFSLAGRTEFGNGTSKGFTFRNITIPYAEAGDPKELSCATPSVTIGNPGFQSGVLFRWTGPSGYTSSSKNPVVTVPGTYVLTVTSGSCTITDEVVVTSSITPGVACAPVLKPIPNRTHAEMVALTLPAATFDATDGDTPAGNLQYTMEDLPEGAVFNASTKVFTWTPTEEQGPGVYLLTARVSDGALDDTVQFKINVTEANRPPVVNQPAPQIVAVGQELTFTATATDPDLPAQQLFFSLSNYSSTQVVPPGATVTPEGHFSWTPTDATVGRFNFNMAVRDDKNSGHYKVFNTTVNAAPVLSPVGNKTAAVGEPLIFSISGTDINNAGQGSQPMKQARVFSLVDAPTDKGPISVTTLPGGDYTGAENVFTRSTSTINGTFSWTPSEPGTYKFKIRLADNGAVPQHAEEEITVVVSDAYTLTITQPTNGTISANPAPDLNGKYTHGTVVTLTATPADGFRFASWTGDAEGTQNPLQLTMDASKTVSATFEPIPSYTLTITPPSNGTISTSPAPNEDGKYRDGTMVILTATPANGYRFVGWDGAVSGNSVTTVVTMDADKTVSATFEAIPPTMYALTLTQPENGSISAEPAAATYAAGSTVTLTATPASGFRFVGWTGDAEGSDTPLQLTMDAAKTVSATFEVIPPTMFALTITQPENGSIAAAPSAATYVAGTVVTLTASPNPGFRFVSWTGDATGTEPTTTLIMGADKAVSATFEAIPPTMYALTITQTANGTISAEPSAATYEDGTVVTLTATPAEGYQFVSWSDDASGTELSTTVTMDSDKTVSATFELIPPTMYTLTLTESENGSIAAEPNAATYVAGTVVTLTATAADGYRFTGWGGDASGSVNPLQLTMDAHKTISATFEAIPPIMYALSINQPDNGSISAVPSAPTYVAGTVVTLTASPADGYRFVGWKGDATGINLTTTVTMDTDKVVSATFEVIPPTMYALTLPQPENGSIAAEPSAPSHEAGTVVTLTATPASGYRFTGWTGDASGTETSTTVTMDADKTVSATFEVIPPIMYALTITQPTGGSIAADPLAATYEAGTIVTLTATPANGYRFVRWTGDAMSTLSPLKLTVDSNKEVSATFEAIPAPGPQVTSFTLVSAHTEQDLFQLADGSAIVLSQLSSTKLNIRANTSPSTVGSVKVELTGAQFRNYTDNAAPYALFGDDGRGNYYYGNWNPPATGTYTLRATPYSGSNGTGTAGTPLTITFTVVDRESPGTQYALSVSTVGGGTVARAPEQDAYAAGTVVTLTATPQAGFRFAGWSGGASGSTNPLQLTMDRSKSVTATFEATGSGPQVTSFTLVSAHTEQDLFQLADGSAIVLSQL
ncbi:InlB B-repeat-containing protein, partial [uncultured Pontibacter sp.]|uniref:InlB B-repeat-containing protein n=1 Tax=uncultured Pontibacter sp. TaxID=453356 RepID=UPI002616011A